jgi:hypothetical protein
MKKKKKEVEIEKKKWKERKGKFETRERYEIDRQQETSWSKKSVADREKIK